MILYGGSMYVRDSTLAENKIMISWGVPNLRGDGEKAPARYSCHMVVMICNLKFLKIAHYGGKRISKFEIYCLVIIQQTVRSIAII